MIILSEAQPHGFKLLNEIREFNSKNPTVKSFIFFHGSFSKKVYGNQVTYATDIDLDYYLMYEDNKDEIVKFQMKILDFFLSKNMLFYECVYGKDERFMFDIDVKKNGKIYNYKPKIIRKKLTDLYKKKIITKDELDEVLDYIVELTNSDIDNLIAIERLKFKLDNFINISWTLEDIKEGKTTHYKKVFNLTDFTIKYLFRLTFIYEYVKGNYIFIDTPLRIFSLPEKFKNKLNTIEDLHSIITDNAKLYGDDDRLTNLFLYHGIFKNYIKEKYFKVLKRMRSLISHSLNSKYENKNNIYNRILKKEEHREYLYDIRSDIDKLTKSTKFSCLNQLKNRSDIIVALTEFKYKDELEIKRLVAELMKDAMYACGYESPDIKTVYDALKTFHSHNSNSNKNKLIGAIKLFKKNMFHHLNMLALPHLIHFYNDLKSKELLVFDLVLPLPDN